MCRGIRRDETKVFWKGFALEYVRATHGDHSMSIKAVLTVLGRAVEETLSVGPLEASTARVRMVFTLAHRWKNTGIVSRIPQTLLPRVEVGEAHAEKRAMASRMRFFAATL